MSTEQLNFNLDKIDTQMGELLEAFESHPRMQPPTPHPSIFFVFDFIRNTHRALKSIDSTKFASGDPEARQAAREVHGRNQFAYTIVSDDSGKLALMTGGDPSDPVDFGGVIRERAKALTEI